MQCHTIKIAQNTSSLISLSHWSRCAYKIIQRRRHPWVSRVYVPMHFPPLHRRTTQVEVLSDSVYGAHAEDPVGPTEADHDGVCSTTADSRFGEARTLYRNVCSRGIEQQLRDGRHLQQSAVWPVTDYCNNLVSMMCMNTEFENESNNENVQKNYSHCVTVMFTWNIITLWKILLPWPYTCMQMSFSYVTLWELKEVNTKLQLCTTSLEIFILNFDLNSTLFIWPCWLSISMSRNVAMIIQLLCNHCYMT